MCGCTQQRRTAIDRLVVDGRTPLEKQIDDLYATVRTCNVEGLLAVLVGRRDLIRSGMQQPQHRSYLSGRRRTMEMARVSQQNKMIGWLSHRLQQTCSKPLDRWER